MGRIYPHQFDFHRGLLTWIRDNIRHNQAPILLIDQDQYRSLAHTMKGLIINGKIVVEKEVKSAVLKWFTGINHAGIASLGPDSVSALHNVLLEIQQLCTRKEETKLVYQVKICLCDIC